ncbi:MAG: homoserine O-acetyltransferase/O-succinyltransferase [Methanobacterium sp.]|uniref:alpha/beta fold hydrolase n=1 Tax=Methanobacterium sp. TaxID=2164 RepID=UPI0003C96801|nr:alpha/beta fold hydrolase [Methanobacterium sp.]MDI3550118.1 homoserine O-acetyltransferase/O-succinyltransferase [Methanobacterium sp.]CDG66055.1 homoserine O-acetyltransferase [Methanobacterium sp. MB1]
MFEPRYHIVKDFQFESGEIISDLKLEYATQGTKKVDEEGNITNAFIYLHGWSGNFASVRNLESVIGSGKAVDTNQFYVISPTALGTPGSSSPSSTGLRTKFPQYTIKDMVNAHYQLLIEGLGIEHVRGIMGTSMGGFQVLNWALEYPDFMDFMILNGTSHRITNRMYGVYHLMNQIIATDQGYDKGNYTHNPTSALENSAYLSYLWSLSPANYEECFSTRSEFIDGIGDRKADSLDWDANDIVWRNKALLGHDLGERISKINIPSLILAINQDQIVDFNYSVLPMHEAIDNSQLFHYDSIWGHYGCTKDIAKTKDAIKKFIESI